MKAEKSGFDVQVFSDSDEMSEYLTRKWQEMFREAIGRRGLFSVALSGGQTPRNFYRRLSEIRNSMWNGTHIFLVDERFVPSTHSESNFRMLYELLLSKVEIPPDNYHPIPVNDFSPEGSAKKYESEIRSFFRLHQSEFPEFDLILLGIGNDGHTASLFPGDEALQEDSHLTRVVFHGTSLHDRITLTLPVLNNARDVLFLVTGEEKSDVIGKVLEERDESLPASLVRPKGNLAFLLDKKAASRLKPHRIRWKSRSGCVL